MPKKLCEGVKTSKGHGCGEDFFIFANLKFRNDRLFFFDQHERTDCWITRGEKISNIFQSLYIMSINYVNGKATVSPVKKKNKATHQCQDCVGGFDFRRDSWAEAGPMDMLDCLVVYEEKLYHVCTGPDHETNAENIS